MRLKLSKKRSSSKGKKALYYIKVSEKEEKESADKKDKKDKRDGQREIWGEEYVQKSMWDGE